MPRTPTVAEVFATELPVGSPAFSALVYRGRPYLTKRGFLVERQLEDETRFLVKRKFLWVERHHAYTVRPYISLPA